MRGATPLAMHSNRSFPVLAKAIRTAAELLASMPSSMDVRALRMVIRAIEEEVAVWATRPPSREDQEAMKERVLAIHLAMPRLVPRKSRKR